MLGKAAGAELGVLFWEQSDRFASWLCLEIAKNEAQEKDVNTGKGGKMHAVQTFLKR